MLQIKRNKLKKELDSRSLKVFNDIVEYIETSLLSSSSIEREEVFQQVLDMMLQAKSEGKFPSQIIGDDIKGFCDAIIRESNYNKSIFHRCFNYIEGISQVGLLLFLMFFITNLISNGWDFAIKNLNVISIDIFTFLFLCVVLFPLTISIRRKNIFRRKVSKIDYSWVFYTVFIYLFMSTSDIIKNKFPQLTTATPIPNGYTIFLLIIFLASFGRHIYHFIKRINKKYLKNLVNFR